MVKMEENDNYIDGEIINVSYDSKFNCKINLGVNSQIYSLELESMKSEIQMRLPNGSILKLKGNINEKLKIIEKPYDVWIKIK